MIVMIYDLILSLRHHLQGVFACNRVVQDRRTRAQPCPHVVRANAQNVVFSKLPLLCAADAESFAELACCDAFKLPRLNKHH
jgi:hypothetical protein